MGRWKWRYFETKEVSLGSQAVGHRDLGIARTSESTDDPGLVDPLDHRHPGVDVSLLPMARPPPTQVIEFVIDWLPSNPVLPDSSIELVPEARRRLVVHRSLFLIRNEPSLMPGFRSWPVT
jgi:hypothetical protein